MDFVTVNTRPIWSFTQEQLQSPTSVGGAPCGDTGWGLTGWKAALLEKHGVLVDSTLTVDQQQHAPAESQNGFQLPM